MNSITPNQKAFLDMIAYSELGAELLASSDNGYNICVGSTPKHLITFSDYSQHPRIRNEKLNSDAAGRYQLMGRYFEPYRILLGLKDFGPASQDAIALQQIKECHAIPFIDAGFIKKAIELCAHIWASFPSAGYGQHENDLSKLLRSYQLAGGQIILGA